jgi:hypothetical protein
MKLRSDSNSNPAPAGGEAAPTAGGRRRPLAWGLVMAALSLLLALGVAEITLRLFFKSRFAMVQDERNLLYRYDTQLGWFPIPNSRDRVRASRTFTVAHNRNGFRDAEPKATHQPGIVFLGDSYTWGFDVEASERFTDLLQSRHPEWSVYNFGISGFGTDQEYLLLQQYFDAYKPKVVFLVFCCENDDDDNSSNMRYGGYYKPYCTTINNQLRLNGIPVPRSERAFLAEHPRLAASLVAHLLVRGWFKLAGPPVEIQNPPPTGAILRDLHRYVTGKGAVLLVGLTQPRTRLEEFLTFFHIPWVNLSSDLRFPGFGQHWTPAGHAVVASKIEEFLAEGHYLNPPSTNGLSQ